MVDPSQQTCEFGNLVGFPAQPPCYVHCTRFCAFRTYKISCQNSKGEVSRTGTLATERKGEEEKEIIFGDAEANHLARGRQNGDLGRMEN